MDWYKKGIIIVFLVILIFPSTNFFINIFDEQFDKTVSFIFYNNLLGDTLYKKEELITKWANINKIMNISIYPGEGFFGKNNFIFLGNNYSNKIDKFRGIYTNNNEKYEKMISIIKGLNKFISDNNTQFIFSISPDKTTIYPEYLPIWITKDQTINTPREELHNYIEKYKLENIYLDPTEYLFGAKNQYEKKYDYLYFISDSHWSTIGSSISFNALLEKLGYFDKVNIIPNEKSFIINFYQEERSPNYLNHLEKYDELQVNNLSKNQYFSDEEILIVSDRSKIYSLIHKKNENAIFNKKVLLVRDSFSNYQIDFYNYYFKDIYYIHYLNCINGENIDSKFIPIFYSLKPDIVVIQMVERSINGILGFGIPTDYKNKFENSINIIDNNYSDINNYQFDNIESEFEKKQLLISNINQNGNIIYNFDSSNSIYEITIKLIIKVNNSEKIQLISNSMNDKKSQELYLISGTNTIYYQFNFKDPILDVSINFPEKIIDNLIIQEFEIRN